MTGTDDWSGKVVLIVGGAGGMGRAAAAEFRKAGASVAIADLRPNDLPTDYLAIAGDVTKVADCERMVSETVARFGRLDVLSVANRSRRGEGSGPGERNRVLATRQRQIRQPQESRRLSRRRE